MLNWRLVILLVLCFGAARLTSAQSPDRKPLDLYIVAGQSNSVGFDANPAELPVDEHDREVLFWFRCGDPPPDKFDSCSDGWTTLQPQPRGTPDLTSSSRERQYGNFQHVAGGFGPEISFARAIRERQGDRPYGIIKASFSGTSLFNDWNPSNSKAPGNCFGALVAEVQAAIAAAEEQGFDCELKALIWVQGESDAAVDVTERYRDALVALLAHLRSELTAPELWGLVGVNTRFLGVDKITPQMEAIIAAQRAVAERDDHCLYVDLDGADLANHVHFSAAGTLEIGNRFAAAYLQATSPWLGKTPRVLFIGLDGTRPDALQAADTPHLDALMSDGIWFEDTDIRSERDADTADTVSGPGWSNLLTGVWPDKHNVLDNSFAEPHYDEYPHFFQRIKESQPNAVTASFSDWKPIAELIVRSADINEHFLEDNDYGAADAHNTQRCCDYLKSADPTAVVLYLGQVDETGHKHGFHPTVPEYVAAIERVDSHIGEVIKAVHAREKIAEENWLILVATDHGGLGTNHGGGRNSPEIRQTFMIVSGPAAQRGTSTTPTWQVDVVATVLKHLGITPLESWQLDGKPVGLR